MRNLEDRPSTRDGFEIAIICALPRETNAVLSAMDELWHDCRHHYGKVAGDDNSYDFGRIGSHSVVIVTLPNMGPVAASSASRSLKISFSAIKLALLVGICGAIPFKQDGSEIILGDVIIGETIVELDYGRQYPHGFKRKDAVLDVHGRPNGEILSLLQRWKVPAILEILRRDSALHLRYLLEQMKADYPGADQDVLFQANYIHKHHASCVECCDDGKHACQCSLTASCGALGCDQSQVVPRQRLEKADHGVPSPLIHIGSIGTGNAVIKSGTHRDQYAQSEGVIGFEMEGVGVWDNVSCIIVKGVCDYADSHKNKIWQDYAAITAAAVAKAVLNEYVMPQKLPQPPRSPYHLVGQNSQGITDRRRHIDAQRLTNQGQTLRSRTFRATAKFR
ncbi:purine and uridine phosphorylase [Aspergillus heterothallicus]